MRMSISNTWHNIFGRRSVLDYCELICYSFNQIILLNKFMSIKCFSDVTVSKSRCSKLDTVHYHFYKLFQHQLQTVANVISCSLLISFNTLRITTTPIHMNQKYIQILKNQSRTPHSMSSLHRTI